MEKSIESVYEWLSLAGFQFNDRTKVSLALSLIQEEFDELKKAIEDNNKDEIYDSFGDLFFTILNAQYFVGSKQEDLTHKFNQIVKSNYSKFCKTREEAIKSAELYIKGEHPSKYGEKIQAKISSSGDKNFPYVVLREDGKLLKSYLYKSPNEF